MTMMVVAAPSGIDAVVIVHRKYRRKKRVRSVHARVEKANGDGIGVLVRYDTIGYRLDPTALIVAPLSACEEAGIVAAQPDFGHGVGTGDDPRERPSDRKST